MVRINVAHDTAAQVTAKHFSSVSAERVLEPTKLFILARSCSAAFGPSPADLLHTKSGMLSPLSGAFSWRCFDIKVSVTAIKIHPHFYLSSLSSHEEWY